MRAGIVTLATIAKHGGRLDPAYYLGDISEEIAAVKRARKHLREAQARLATVLQRARDKRAAHRKMLADGDVRRV